MAPADLKHGNWDRAMKLKPTAYATRLRRLLFAVVAMNAVAALSSTIAAEPLILQGSTTFNRRVMEPFEATIETKSGQDITVIPNRTMLGIIALLEGRAHMAMISAPLESEVTRLKKAMPGLDYQRLQAFEIASTRAAFVVHPTNAVRKATREQIKKVLTGEITDWSALGGKPGVIRLAAVGGGGGVITAAEAELLDGKAVSNPNVLYVRTALQLISVVEQEANVLGVAQLSLAKQRGLPELVTDVPVEQTLSLVTLGNPTPAMQAVIDAARQAVDKTM
jgi:phosphate transport system substrate-binding protein